MFVVLLRFGENKPGAPKHMDAHNAWIKQGMDDGVFLVVGSLQPNAGGAILAHGVSRDELETRVSKDPFVKHDVVNAEILEIDPKRADERLGFLLS